MSTEHDRTGGANHGNQITGGTFTGNIAVGDNATINVVGAAPATEPARLARELRALVDANAGALDQPDRARRDAAEIADELARPEPEQDRDRLADTLNRLAGRVTSVAALVEAVEALRKLLFG